MSCCASPGRVTSSMASSSAAKIVKRRMKFSPRIRVLVRASRLLLWNWRDDRATADHSWLLPTFSGAVLIEKHQIRLCRAVPLAEFALRDRELLTHFHELLGLPNLHRGETSTEGHSRG